MKIYKISSGYGGEFLFKRKEDAEIFLRAILETVPMGEKSVDLDKLGIPDKDGWRGSDKIVVGLSPKEFSLTIFNFEPKMESEVEEMKEERRKANEKLLNGRKSKGGKK